MIHQKRDLSANVYGDVEALVLSYFMKNNIIPGLKLQSNLERFLSSNAK